MLDNLPYVNARVQTCGKEPVALVRLRSPVDEVANRLELMLAERRVRAGELTQQLAGPVSVSVTEGMLTPTRGSRAAKFAPSLRYGMTGVFSGQPLSATSTSTIENFFATRPLTGA